MNKALEHYRDNGFKIVEGWVEDELFTTIDYFNNLPINKTGGVCEIGVHHGKLFLLLNFLLNSIMVVFRIVSFCSK